MFCLLNVLVLQVGADNPGEVLQHSAGVPEYRQLEVSVRSGNLQLPSCLNQQEHPRT